MMMLCPPCQGHAVNHHVYIVVAFELWLEIVVADTPWRNGWNSMSTTYCKFYLLSVLFFSTTSGRSVGSGPRPMKSSSITIILFGYS